MCNTFKGKNNITFKRTNSYHLSVMHSSSGVLHLHFVINLKNESNLLKQKKTRSVVSETVHTIGATNLKKDWAHNIWNRSIWFLNMHMKEENRLFPYCLLLSYTKKSQLKKQKNDVYSRNKIRKPHAYMLTITYRRVAYLLLRIS